jgi:hypothetical protein
MFIQVYARLSKQKKGRRLVAFFESFVKDVSKILICFKENDSTIAEDEEEVLKKQRTLSLRKQLSKQVSVISNKSNEEDDKKNDGNIVKIEKVEIGKVIF